MVDTPLDLLPMWAFFLLACAFVALPLEIGHRLGRNHRLRQPNPDDPSVGVSVGSLLALLAFLLAFTFSMAASRYDDRRQIVLEEANAIGTTYLRARFLPEPERTEAAALLREYVDVRLKAAEPGTTFKDLSRAIVRSEEIQADLWDRATSVAERSPTVLTSLFVQALNEMIDVHGKRIMIGVRTRIPLSIWLGLALVAMVGLSSAGFQAGLAVQQRSIVMVWLVLSFATVLTLIADLDHPQKGMIRNTQTPMMDLRSSMSSPPSHLKPANSPERREPRLGPS
jgi:hypothetical protein